MKLGDFPEDVSIEVFAGKHYFDDARTQPQRLLDVISLGNREMKSHTVRVFLYPGENVSVHCYSKHNYRQKNGEQGAYIKQLKVRGPVLDQWPPSSYQNVFGGLPMKAPPREAINASVSQTKLKAIGGSVSVSSSQKGMEKEKMQDGSNRTYLAYAVQANFGQASALRDSGKPARQANRRALVRDLVGGEW